ncbi:MAG: DUF2779 domain-containing protein [Chitinophagaceae bacterium]|nr:DUF2779 domain-containing protein [Chitinophagaceae bacterium]
MSLLTKSKFKLGLECPTKLFYSSHPDQYEDNSIDDQFLQALAEGGYQVGELAKFLFCEDPIEDDITVHEFKRDLALQGTTDRRRNGAKVIAEAAFRHENLFVRCDIITEDENSIRIYEVKAKSWDDKTEFISTSKRGANAGQTKLNREWSQYMYDIAFQKYVVERAVPEKKLFAYIILVDKTTKTSIDGLNQIFRINRDESGRVKIAVQNGICQKDLGAIPLKVLNVDDVCNWIYSNTVDIVIEGPIGFEETIGLFSSSLENDRIIWANSPTTICKECQFRNDSYPEGKKSGFHECWKKIAHFNDDDFSKPLSLELWGGKAGAKSIVGDSLRNQKYFISQLDQTDFASSKWVPSGASTLDATQRRIVQIDKTNRVDYAPHIDKEGLSDLFESLPAPYHFIDFETTAVAIPFHKNRRPYEGLAFQYSYHLMSENGSIEHKNQFLSFEKGAFPSYDFLRSLRRDLTGQPGTIFRYHNHENTYLNLIYKQLFEDKSVPDRDDLMSFIQEISHPSSDSPDKWEPKNDMKDLYDYVLSHFYSLHSKGSNSIKQILPAVIKSSPYLQKKYTQPIYGTEIRSLNFTSPHIWLNPEKGYDPYKTLPEVFPSIDELKLDLNDGSLTELADGGAAMMAYAYLQFTDLPEDKRILYRDALLRYCELDTMAMAMIWEYWGHEIKRW